LDLRANRPVVLRFLCIRWLDVGTRFHRHRVAMLHEGRVTIAELRLLCLKKGLRKSLLIEFVGCVPQGLYEDIATPVSGGPASEGDDQQQPAPAHGRFSTPVLA
jgi:hypothetical protein